MFYLIYRSPQNASRFFLKRLVVPHRQAPFAGHGEDVQIPAIASGGGDQKSRASAAQNDLKMVSRSQMIHVWYIYIYTLWLFNIAMGNGPFIDGLPIKNGDFPWLY